MRDTLEPQTLMTSACHKDGQEFFVEIPVQKERRMTTCLKLH